MFRKLVSLLAALALCFDLLPGQVHAAGDTELLQPPVMAEPAGLETLEEPEEPVQPMVQAEEEMPREDDIGH